MVNVARLPMVRVLTAVVALGAGLLAQENQPVFRAGIDLIPVDVQIVSKDGNPVLGLDAAQFDVTVGGKKRRVVSVNFVDYRTTSAGPPSSTSSSVIPQRAESPTTQPGAPRIF